MINILDIAAKDLTLIVRDRKTFLFLLIMPVAFTLLFGFAFAGAGKAGDARLPVVVMDLDGSLYSQELRGLLENSQVIRLVPVDERSRAEVEQDLGKGDLSAIVVIPTGFGASLEAGKIVPLEMQADQASLSGTTIQGELVRLARQLASAAWISQAVGAVAPQASNLPDLEAGLAAWKNPPVGLKTSLGVQEEETANLGGFTNTSPGMMMQFGIAGLLTAATVVVVERKSRCLDRLRTTPVGPWKILLGHYLAMFVMILTQFVLLVLFGQLLLKVNYFQAPLASGMITLTSVMWIAALGLLIGMAARSEEQAIVFALLPMFLLAGLGGAWVPLEITGATFQKVGHISPVAWGMDGYKNITLRGLGVEAAWLPSLAMIGYALFFFAIAAWMFSRQNRK